jgi:REP element-mobilizing transposase RayT
MITRRCTQRQLLLRPDQETNNAFTYCLIEAALRFGIEVLLPCAMSNHHHTVIYDRDGRYPEFVEHFHKLMARSQNALRGRWENFWASEQVCVVKLVDREAVIDKLVYTATNPVQAHLVDRVHHWPGVNGLVALLTGRPLHARRPLHFFRPDGPMPYEVEMRLTIPSCSRSCSDGSRRSKPSTRRRDSGPAGRCSDGAPCSGNRIARIRPAWNRGGISAPWSLAGASGQGSRRFCVTAHSSKSMFALARRGATAARSYSRWAPTGSDGSRTSSWRRPDVVDPYTDEMQRMPAESTHLGWLITPEHRHATREPDSWMFAAGIRNSRRSRARGR